MKICIYGAGAIGGYLGAGLALAGNEVTLIARGPHLEAMRKNGLKLISDGETHVCHPFCTDDPKEAGPQDAVVIGLKAHSLPKVAASFAPLLGPETMIVTAQNGIPYWYFYKHGGPLDGTRLASVDPDGSVWENMPPERAIGCVVYPACEILEPGVIQHVKGNRFQIGEPDGSRSDRLKALSKVMMGAGFKSPPRPRIRDDIWVKLWGNLSFNPVSALTHATLDVLATDPDSRPIIREIMVESESIASVLGIKFPVDVDTRIEWARDVGAHKTSMLQDLEMGRPMEIDAIVGAVSELGRLTGVETPTIDRILGLVRQRARIAGCYDG
jgi:2-dehydropantoate 2-reductase